MDVVLRQAWGAVVADDEGPAEAAAVDRDLDAVAHEDDGRKLGEQAVAAREAEAMHEVVRPGVHAEHAAVEQHDRGPGGVCEARRVQPGHRLHAQHVRKPAWLRRR